MFVEPKLVLDLQLLEQHRTKYAEDVAEKIKNSGVTREILASNNKFSEHLQELNVVIPTKKSPSTGEMIPAFSKNDPAYQQMCNSQPEYKHIWEALSLIHI